MLCQLRQQRLYPILKIPGRAVRFKHSSEHSTDLGDIFVDQSAEFFDKLVGVMGNLNVRRHCEQPFLFFTSDSLQVAN